MSELTLAQFSLRVASPALAFLAALAVIPLRRPYQTAESDSPVTQVVVASRTPRRAAILTLLSLVALTYLLDGLTFVVYAVIEKKWPVATGLEINSVLGLVAFAGLAALGAWKDVKGVDVWGAKRILAGVNASLVLDVAQVALQALILRKTHVLHAPPATVAHFAFPAFRVLLLLPLSFALAHPRVSYASVVSDEPEEVATAASLLLPEGLATSPSTGLSPTAKDHSAQYGTFRTGRSTINVASGPTTRANTPAPSTRAKIQPPGKEDIALDPSWSEIYRRLKRISPYLWPSKSRALQFLALACLGLLALGRVINLFLPIILASLIEVLAKGDGNPWPYLFAYVGLRYLQSGGGISALRDVLWAPVMQYSDREMSQLSFDHLLNLSLSFHTRRKTGEVLRILDRGAAINRIFELLLFNGLPIFADIIIALVVFVIRFEWTLALLIFFDMVAYMAASVILTSWRTKLRRQMNDRDVITRGIHTDCLLNYETVKYFNGEQHEGERYADAIRQYQALEYKVITSLNLLNLIQNLIICLGLLLGSMIVALRVTRGQSKASDFVLFITYIQQLYGPLAMLGSIYRSINQGLVDTERLLKLLNEPTEVNDNPDASDLVVTDGEIEFDNVNFSYDGRVTALGGVSFKVPKGSSVALVGESGSGKSTILRLLYRFYDLKEGEGRILIDGQDIRDVTQSSLRKAIGVVPQDSVLFNHTIKYNIGYGKFGSSDDEIEAAARAAQMHERIMSFPDGYETKVGERGVRLSGGEKQRVAIARTLLKNPPVLLLDEATSALDTSTEKDIQKALQHLVQGRSSLSIAHRLSTIASADLILVLKDGHIVEQGTHGELLALNGIFAAMWADQVNGSDDGASSSHGGHGDIKEPVAGYFIDAPEPQVPAVESIYEPTVQSSQEQEPETFTPAPVEEEQPKPSYAAVAASNSPIVESKSLHNEVQTEEAPELAAAETSEPAKPELKVEPQVEAPKESAPIAFPSSPIEEEAEEPFTLRPAEETEPQPQPPTSAPAPVSFPKGDDAVSLAPSATPADDSTPAQTPGVTFSPETNSRSETPDQGAASPDPKRKRISSQNFQRLARRISISGRRQASSGSIPVIASLIPGLKRSDSAPKDSALSTEPRDSGSVSNVEGATSSATPPPPQEEAQGKLRKDKKKDKKEKRKTLG